MAERKPFLLRLDPETMDALRAWSADDLRSLNGQIEFLLRRALRDAGRLPVPGSRGRASSGSPVREDEAAAGRAGRPGSARRNDVE